MPLSKSLFRESALERLASPEQLDQLLQVTNPKGWISLVAIWLLLAAVVAWAFLGSVPTTEDGQGILVTGGGLKQVLASGTGRLEEIKVKVGDEIAVGQVVAKIGKQDIEDQLRDTALTLDELRSRDERLTNLEDQDRGTQARLADVEKRRLEQESAFAEARIGRLESRKATIIGLIQQGNMTDIDQQRVEEEIEQSQMVVQQNTLSIQQLEAKAESAEQERTKARAQRTMELEELSRKVEMVQKRLGRESEVTSTLSGRVVEVRAALQAAMTVGDPILLIEPKGENVGNLEAIVYVSAATGKRIKPGMEVDITPSTVKREEYGSMQGTVEAIADVPTSQSAMMAVLSDQDLTKKFTEAIGLPLEMRVKLTPDPDPASVSGFKWSSPKGPPIKISAGTLCGASVTVKEQRPIELVIPLVRRTLGGD